MKKLIIIGGVAGGASAAAKARRVSEDAEIILFEKCEYISFANCGLPYHISGVIQDRNALLVQTADGMKNRFRIDVRIKHEVLSIDRIKKTITAINLLTNKQYEESYDNLILSPGASPIFPTIPGIENSKILSLRNMSDMDKIINIISQTKHKSVAIIGGGFIGLEMAEALHAKNLKVSLIQSGSQVMNTVDQELANLIHQELIRNNIDLRLNSKVTGFSEKNDQLSIQMESGEYISADFVILAIGVKPEIKLAKDSGIAIGNLGGILVNDSMQTNDPDIYAVGDAVEIKHFVDHSQSLIPLAGPANRQARIAVNNIFGGKSNYKKTQGTSICKIFDITVASTGLNEKSLKKSNKAYEKIYLHNTNHASYYPGSKQIHLKLLFSIQNGKILGAQAIGYDGVDKRIDVLAVAIRANMTVYELEDLELCYAPPYGSAKDILNYAGFVASNVLKNETAIIHSDKLDSLTDKNILLDVRTNTEFQSGTIPGSINIPVDDLRNRLSELDHNNEYIVFCKVGLRGYLACRILMQNGFNCRNLSGGYTTYLMFFLDLDNLKNNSIKQIKIPAQQNIKHIDACGLQCPGPIQKLKACVDEINPGESFSITATDSGFFADAKSWCNSTGNIITNIEAKQGNYTLTIQKTGNNMQTQQQQNIKKKITIAVFSGDLDRALAAFVIANGAISMGYEPVLLFTFWGLNVLRKDAPQAKNKNIIEKCFGWMMPKGANKLALSKLNMLGMGRELIKHVMKDKKVASLPEMINQAVTSGVKLIACTMSMEIMGIKKEELIEGVTEGGVASYLGHAEESNINLFV